jgi:hypothetical protein
MLRRGDGRRLTRGVMNLILQYEFDDASTGNRRRFRLLSDRPYPGVPRAGDWILPGDLPPNLTQQAIQVREAVFKNDGSVILELGLTAEFTADTESLAATLAVMGYLEVSPAPSIGDDPV